MFKDTLTILTINDIYKFNNDGVHGGFARISTLVKQRRKELGPNCLFTVNGDFIGGSRMAVSSQGEAGTHVLEEMQVDRVVLGNHEFDFGADRLEVLIQESNFDWICSNVYRRVESSLEILFPGVIAFKIDTVECNGVEVRIGWFGLCTPSSIYTSDPGDSVLFKNCIECAKNTIDILKRKHGCQIIIAMTHLELNQDQDVAEQVEGIDLILGGHDHQPFAHFYGSTLLFKCGQNGYWLGEIKLAFQADPNDPMNVTLFPSWTMHSTFNVHPDRDVTNRIARLADSHVNDTGDAENLFLLTQDFDTRTNIVRCHTATSTNFIADMLWKSLKGDLGLINGGFVRGDRVYPAGSYLTDKIIRYELPFPKHAALLEIEERHLWIALEQMLAKTPAAIGSYPHVSSNCRLKYSSKLKPMNKIVEFSITDTETGNTRCINKSSTKKVKVGLSEFMSDGGDGCIAFREGTRIFITPEITKEHTINFLRRISLSNEILLEIDNAERVTDLQ